MSRLPVLVGVVLFAQCLVVYAQPFVDTSAYRTYSSSVVPNVMVPTVVEVPLSQSRAESGEYLVLDVSTNTPIPSYFRETFTSAPVSVSAQANGYPTSRLTDGNRFDGERFEVTSPGWNVVTIELSFPIPVTASRLALTLGRNVSYPSHVMVSVIDDSNSEQIVYNIAPFNDTSLSFIQTTARNWRISFTYVQPLQINEITLLQDSVEMFADRGLRFLAQPGGSYQIYRDADRSVSIAYGVQGDLVSDTGVVRIAPVSWMKNSLFVPVDSDSDRVPDTRDNCVTTANTNQDDIDQNGKGDACEDYDRDGYPSTSDNCPNIPNYQQDTDGDGIGDECDAEESRFTERLPWVPWVGMGIAGFVLLGLFIFVAMDMRKKGDIQNGG